jgi:hypothetical protein
MLSKYFRHMLLPLPTALEPGVSNVVSAEGFRRPTVRSEANSGFSQLDAEIRAIQGGMPSLHFPCLTD